MSQNDGTTETPGQQKDDAIDNSQWKDKPYPTIILQGGEAIFEIIHQSQELDRLIRYFALQSFYFAAIYGAALGAYSLNFQIPSSAIKVPLLLLGTIAICLPALFTFNVLLGSKLAFKQTLAVLLVANYLISLILVSLASILLFFVVSTPNTRFIFGLNLVFFVIAGLMGVSVLWRGIKYLTKRSKATYNPTIIQVWSLIYIFVGTQLSWLLRPFIGTGSHFAIFRNIEGNFYSSVFNVIHHAF